MLKLIKPTDAMPARPIIVTIAGYTGLGKSSLAFTSDSPIVFDFEGSVSRVKPMLRDYDTIPVDRSNYEEWHLWVSGKTRMDGVSFDEYVQASGIKTVVLDTIGAMLERCVSPYIALREPKYAQKDGNLNQKGWGEMQRHCKELILSFTERGLDVLIIAHVKEADGSDDTKVLKPSIKGGTIEFVLSDSDMIGYMRKELKTDKTIIDFNPSAEQLGKNTAGLPKLVVPSITEIKKQRWVKTKIFDACKESMRDLSEAQKVANKAITTFTSRIAECETCESINELAPEIAKLDAPIKIQVEAMAARRFADLYCGDIEEAAALTALVAQIAEDSALTSPQKSALKSRLGSIADRLGLVYSKEAKCYVQNEGAKN